MPTVASRDLRNHTREILQQVAAGSLVTITLNGKPVATLGPPASALRAHLSRSEVARLITRQVADDTLGADLAWISGDTTDDLDAIR